MKKMITVLGIGITTLEFATLFILRLNFNNKIISICKEQYGVSTPEEALAIIMAEKQKEE